MKLLPLLLLTGCPLIPGKFEDYAGTGIDTDPGDTGEPVVFDPDQFRIVGVGSWIELLGDYWDEPAGTKSGSVTLGWLDEWQDDPDVLGIFVQDGSGCGDGVVDVPEFLGFDVARPKLAGADGDISLSQDVAVHWYTSDLGPGDVEIDEPLDLLATKTVDGEDAVPGIMTFPQFMHFRGPDVDQATAPVGGPADLQFTWTASSVNDRFSQVVVGAVLYPEQGPITKSAWCIAEADAESIKIPPSKWTTADLSDAYYWKVYVGGIAYHDTDIEGGRGKARVVTLTLQTGVVLYEP